MIVKLKHGLQELKTMEDAPTSPEDQARVRREIEEFSRNVKWFNARAREIYAAHAGKYMVVLGQELFVGDDSAEVRSRAFAAHPECTGGSLANRLASPSMGG